MDLSYDGYCWDRGGFRQRDLTPRTVYDQAYLDYYRGLEDKVQRLTRLRWELVRAVVREPEPILDFGSGCGHFVRLARQMGHETWGYDVAPGADVSMSWEEAVTQTWGLVTFFDSLEHCPYPAAVLRALAPRHVLVSVPWCHYPDRQEWFMQWKHRKPGEHLWHFSREGLDQFLSLVGYEPLLHCCLEDEVRTRYDPDLPNILTALYRKRT